MTSIKISCDEFSLIFRIFYSNQIIHSYFSSLIIPYYFIFHFDFERGEWRDNATWYNCRNHVDDETSTVRQPQYASTSLSSCRTFLALRQRARFRWLNQLLLLFAFPVRIFHLDTDLSHYFVLLHSREWISPTTFIHFPSIDEFVAPFLRLCCRVNDSKIFFIVWSSMTSENLSTVGNNDRSYTKSG